jgi:hypothetical protein
MHASSLRRRREWFRPSAGSGYVLWWVPAGQRPGFVEGQVRLDQLTVDGPIAGAFNFAHPFEPPSGEPAPEQLS